MHKQRVVFVHGLGSFGAAAWPKQHGMALAYDALFLRRHGFDAVAEPVESNVAADVAIVINALVDPAAATSWRMSKVPFPPCWPPSNARTWCTR